MTARVRFTAKQFAHLQQHLDEPEQVAFAYATFADGRFDIVDVQPMVGNDIASRSDRHVELNDDVRPRLISTASARGLCLVEAHSHGPRGHAAFSQSDLLGFDQWVPHLWWRLRGQPYAALVASGRGWDALAWIKSPNEPEGVAAIEATGGLDTSVILPTGATLSSLGQRGRRLRETA